MASNYDETKLTKLGHLKDLAEKIKADYTKKTEFDALSSKVDGLVSTGGEPNVIESITVNGDSSKVKVTEKTADITIPTKVSEFENDVEFQKKTEVETAIQTAISKTGHATFETAESVPDAKSAKENVLYLVMNDETSCYDIYAKVGESVVRLDDTTVDLSKYSTTEDITKLLEKKVDVVSGKQLSTEDFTAALKSKLEGIDENANNYTHPDSEAGGSKLSDLYKIATDAQGHVSGAVKATSADIAALGVAITDTTYSDVTPGGESGLMSGDDKTKLDGMVIAEDEEVQAMLDEVFAA